MDFPFSYAEILNGDFQTSFAFTLAFYFQTNAMSFHRRSFYYSENPKWLFDCTYSTVIGGRTIYYYYWHCYYYYYYYYCYYYYYYYYYYYFYYHYLVPSDQQHQVHWHSPPGSFACGQAGQEIWTIFLWQGKVRTPTSCKLNKTCSVSYYIYIIKYFFYY